MIERNLNFSIAIAFQIHEVVIMQFKINEDIKYEVKQKYSEMNV